MTYEEMHQAAGDAVKTLKEALGEQGTVIVMMTNAEGAHVVTWNWFHPMIALGLTKLGMDAVSDAVLQTNVKKPVSPFKIVKDRDPK